MYNWWSRDFFSSLRLLISCRYRPSISIDFIAQELGFASVDECRDFLISQIDDVGYDPDSVFRDTNSMELDTKISSVVFAEVIKKFQKVDIKGQI
jgi:hypothetical protein